MAHELANMSAADLRKLAAARLREQEAQRARAEKYRKTKAEAGLRRVSYYVSADEADVMAAVFAAVRTHGGAAVMVAVSKLGGVSDAATVPTRKPRGRKMAET